MVPACFRIISQRSRKVLVTVIFVLVVWSFIHQSVQHFKTRVTLFNNEQNNLPEYTDSNAPLHKHLSFKPENESKTTRGLDNSNTVRISTTNLNIVTRISTTELLKIPGDQKNVVPTSKGPRITPSPPTGFAIPSYYPYHRPTEPCPGKPERDQAGRPVTDGRWYDYSLPSFRFLAYSAFYDDRPAKPVIRIITVSTEYEKYVNETHTEEPFLYCALHYDKTTVHVPIESPPKEIGRGWNVLGEWSKEYIYNCPTDSGNGVPYAVSIVPRPGNTSVTSCIPVEIPDKPKKREEVAICVQSSYGSGVSPYALIEWLELQSMLGVTYIGIYNLSMNYTYDKIFHHYQNTGLVHVRNASYFVQGGRGENVREFMIHGSPAINDCFYRVMHRFNYVAVLDFDEVILPQNYTTLPEMLHYLDKFYSTRIYPPINYAFYNQYYFLDLAPDSDQSPYLTISRFRRKVARSPYGYAVKSVINPRACVQMHNHWCWGVTPQYKLNASPEVIEDYHAVNQHYKTCHFEESECKKILKGNVTLDMRILNYRDKLKERTQKIVLELFNQNI